MRFVPVAAYFRIHRSNANEESAMSKIVVDDELRAKLSQLL